ncbi:hypothetical protein O181_017082 [Austropuccinia psidii MF-1]|uniref:Major facilitator superfamily (MFS) profile domain-containing protein n=1 Tax=Austropuccinia psidii MF-1 TaxID=1389203 RepID=A0A9Q3C583_9BASI|nr:hypothetical protein [Austropuccinia psidii MF-1]
MSFRSSHIPGPLTLGLLREDDPKKSAPPPSLTGQGSRPSEFGGGHSCRSAAGCRSSRLPPEASRRNILPPRLTPAAVGFSLNAAILIKAVFSGASSVGTKTTQGSHRRGPSAYKLRRWSQRGMFSRYSARAATELYSIEHSLQTSTASVIRPSFSTSLLEDYSPHNLAYWNPMELPSHPAPVHGAFDDIETSLGNTKIATVAADIATTASLGKDVVYETKARILNSAIQEIGMGKYQWKLFVVIGFGWASDNLWPIVTSLILTPVAQEFGADQPPLLTLSQNIGLLIGALFWGIGCDVFGRKLGFNITIGMTAVFGLLSAASPNFLAIALFAALWSIGVGGNLPVDSAIFIEFLPGSHQYLLTILSVFWSLAQLLVTLVAWPLLSNLTCQPKAPSCGRSENNGWRFFMIAVGGFAFLMCAIRLLAFHLYESPKYLMSRGLDAEAVAVVHAVARCNGTNSSLTLGDLKRFEQTDALQVENLAKSKTRSFRSLKKLDMSHLHSLFATPKLAFSTSLIILIWAFIGLGFPLYNAFIPFIQSQRGIHFGDGSRALTYRNSSIIAAAGVPGALIGGLAVQMPQLGRKGALAFATCLTGIILFASTTAVNSNSLLAWNCAFGLASNIMYAILYSYTPEIFMAKNRGTGNALTAAANRIFGIMAPIVAIYSDLKTSLPVYISGALFISAGLLALLLPFETRGKASL